VPVSEVGSEVRQRMTKAHTLRDMRYINGVNDEKPYSCRITAVSLGVGVANAQSLSHSASAQNSVYQPTQV